MRLTDKYIASLKFAGKKVKYFDDGLPNFGVRVYKSGISFVVMMGNERRMRTIGRYPNMSLKEARKRAVRIINEDDPYVRRKSAENAIAEFLENSARRNKPRTTADYKRLLNLHFPDGDLQSLTRIQLIKKLDSLVKTPGEQAHAASAFNVFLNWCVGNGYREQNPLLGIKRPGRINRKDRVLTDHELRLMFVEAQATEPPFGVIIQLLIQTGLRRGEVVALQREWIGDVITIPSSHTKNGREHNLPFGEMTKPLFTNLPLTFNGWGKSKKRLDEPLNIEPYTLHDLRRTFASNHARLGTPIHVVEKMLNHVSGTLSGVAGVYNRYNYLDEMREACHRYESWLETNILQG